MPPNSWIETLMRVPLQWLTEYVEPGLDTDALAERLALTGTEVERVERYGVSALEQFVVGRVLERKRHPDADRLSVCMVDTGGSTPSQIVCGAPNVAAGQIVAVAKPGAVMPDGTRLNKARLRGVESNGMILAEDELGLGIDHNETLVLVGDELKPGMPLSEVLTIATDVLVLEITPNRPDCLGIYGVAREVHAATGTPLAPPPWRDDGQDEAASESSGITITVESHRLCPRFTARVFDDVQIGPSPLWLKARLMAAGQRPISNVVDITNYVMLLTGQPLHAFDLDRVAGASLNVRAAREGETVQTLDGQTRRLDSEMVLIADADGATSIAGIMGGARSEVQNDTTRVLMEVANWDGANIHRTSLKLGLRSEASARFEKQLQPEQAMEAQAVATQLMTELCGAHARPGTVDVGGPGPAPATIRLRERRVRGLLGTTITRSRSKQLLEALEFTTAETSDGLDVTVPPFRRGDVLREADLIEEVARLDGVEKLPATLPSRHGAAGRLTYVQRRRRRAVDVLRAQGLEEIVGWSFVGADAAERLRLGGEVQFVELANPMSNDQSRLRTTLLSSLLDVARRNRARGASALRLFEAGAVYLPQPDAGERLPREPYHLAALLTGPIRPATWREGEPPAADFFSAKGILAGLLEALCIPWRAEPAALPFLHPGRAAGVVVEGEHVGWLGEIHPSIAGDWELPGTVAGFEIDLDALPVAPTATYTDLISFPEVHEDLAFVVADSVSAAELLAVLRDAGQPLLRDAEVFDVYRDPEKLGAGRVSLALHLAYRAADRTLTDQEVAAQREEIVAAVSERLRGSLRAA
ncbi:MAG: phenylalanine--tRNA ligase subunit beta [Solirubrobacterales bacterium]|nr:phenylalanine--tRNA ligase subunit beta [Solirubrobacterales bacterium]